MKPEELGKLLITLEQHTESTALLGLSFLYCDLLLQMRYKVTLLDVDWSFFSQIGVGDLFLAIVFFSILLAFILPLLWWVGFRLLLPVWFFAQQKLGNRHYEIRPELISRTWVLEYAARTNNSTLFAYCERSKEIEEKEFDRRLYLFGLGFIGLVYVFLPHTTIESIVAALSGDLTTYRVLGAAVAVLVVLLSLRPSEMWGNMFIGNSALREEIVKSHLPRLSE